MVAPNRRILLVEDSEQDVELTLAALEARQLNEKVDVARDGAEALDYLYRRNAFVNRPPGMPMLVMLDLKMPRVDGLEVLATLKSDISFRTIPVVMLTSSREEQDLLQSYQLGVNAYVVKPVDFAQFNHCVQQLGLFWTLINELPEADAGVQARSAL